MPTIETQHRRRIQHHQIHAGCGSGSVGCGRAVIDLTLSESECLCSAQLGPVLTKSSHLSFASVCMLLRIHLNIVLGKAANGVFHEELTVPTFQDVHLWVGKLWVLIDVSGTILLSHMASHDGCTVSRVFAVKDEESLARQTLFEKLACQQLLIIVVHSAIDVATLKLVFKTAVDDHSLVELAIVTPIQNTE